MFNYNDVNQIKLNHSKEELEIAIDFSVNCGELVEKITEAAYTKYHREHSSKVVWGQILQLSNVSSQKV